jgi:hypothetical protein
MPDAYPYPGMYEITLVTVSRVLQGEAVYPLCGLHHDAAGYFGHPMNKSDTFSGVGLGILLLAFLCLPMLPGKPSDASCRVIRCYFGISQCD